MPHFLPTFCNTSPHLPGSSPHSPHSEFRMYFSPLNFAPVISDKLVAGVFVLRAAMLPFNSPQSTQSSTEFSLLCHSDDRREEESRKHQGEHKWMHTRSFVARLLWMTMMKALPCHSERSEDGLLRTPSEKSREHQGEHKWMHTRSFVAPLLWMTMMKALPCHSDDRREEESRKHKGGYKWMHTRSFVAPLLWMTSGGRERKDSVRLRVTRW